MLLAFTYFTSSQSDFFIKSAVSFKNNVPEPNEISLVIFSDSEFPAKLHAQVSSMFGEVTILKRDFPNSDGAISAHSFMEVLTSYSQFDRIYFDSTLIFVNSVPTSANTSIFFKQYQGRISTKFVFLKNDPILNRAIIAIGNKANSLSSDLSFTHFISSNFLILKSLSPTQIVNGKLLNNTIMSNLNLSQITAIDMSGIINQNQNEVDMLFKKINIDTKQFVVKVKKNKEIKPGFFSNVLKSINSKISYYQANVSFFGNPEKYFSIVIPTMWRSNKIFQMLKVYESSEFVKEVIIIDNDPVNTPDLSAYSKVKRYTRGKNIFVNPAWNWGSALAKYNLILANDDIIINRFDHLMNVIATSEYDILGIKLGNNPSKNIEVEPVYSFPSNSYGVFMFVRNYTYIPEQLRIWYGDNILFNRSAKRGIIVNSSIDTAKSETINSDTALFRDGICANDTRLYNGIINSQPSNINIIIRTSGRPVYFSKCIASIKKYCPSAKIHVTIDNEDDLSYVKKFTSGLNTAYYFINRETIETQVSKIKTFRPKFIYNYYFNVVHNFVNGWCLYLDDDDVLVSTPEPGDNTSTIYLYRSGIGDKVVPSDSNFGKIPVINDISGLGILFHSTMAVDWLPQRGGDYTFISEMYKKCKVVWLDKMLSKTQTTGNFGNRNDLHSSEIIFEPNKIAICIPMYGRPEISEFVFRYYADLKKKLTGKIDLLLLACGSEQSESRDIAERNGFEYAEFPNFPLAQKHNKLYWMAKPHNPHACLKIDSDSIVSEEFFRYYDRLINEGYDYSGIEDIYFLVRDFLCYWSGYEGQRKGETTGVGRFMSRKLLDMLEWTPWGNSTINTGFDLVLTKRVNSVKHNIKTTTTKCSEVLGICIDIKSPMNLSDFSDFYFDSVIPLADVSIPINFDPILPKLLTCEKSKIKLRK